jgi:uncharacterized OsmC-like protein
MEVQATWKKNYQVEVRARQFSVPIDEAREFHGDDTGMMPTELFLGSLASCFCLALVFEIKDMRVNVKGEKDLKNFIFSKLIVEVDSSLPSETLQGIIPLARKYCFVSNTVSKSCPIEYVQKDSGGRIQDTEERKHTSDS